MAGIIPNFNAATHTNYGTETDSTKGWTVLSGPGAVNSIAAGCQGRYSIELTVDPDEACVYTVDLNSKSSLPIGTTFTLGFQARKHCTSELLLSVKVNDDSGQVILDQDPMSPSCKNYQLEVTLEQSLKKICFRLEAGDPNCAPIIDGLWIGTGGSPSGGGGGADPDSRPSGALQDFIDGRLTNDTMPMSSIKAEGMTGDVYVPPGVNVSFYDCDLGDAEFGGDNSVFIYGGSMNFGYFSPGGDFWIQDTEYINRMEIWGSDGTIRNTEFRQELNIYEQSNIELIDATFISPKILDAACSSVKLLRPVATVPETGIAGKQANIIISGAHFEQKTGYVIKAEDHSFVQISDSHIEGYYDCPALTVSGNSVGIVTQANGYCPAPKGLYSGVWVVKATTGSYVRIKDSQIQGSPGNWSDYGLWADDNSIIEAVGDGAVNIDGGDFPAVRASQNSSVSVTNYNRIWAATKEGIYCDDNSLVKVFGLTTKIQSDAVDAIWIRDHSRVEVYDVPLIYAPVGDAVDMSEYCDFIGVNISDKMEGVKDYGVLATVHCNAKLDRVANCIGDGEDGIYVQDYSRVIAINGQVIMGKGDNGIEAKNNSQVVVKDYTEEVVGLATDGLHMDEDCRATLVRVAKIRGVGKDGIYMSDNCTCFTRYCDEIKGEGRDGIYMEDTCRAVSVEDGIIQGLGRDGVHGETSCEFTSERGDQILGTARDGIFMSGGRLINVRRTAEVRGLGRDGIHADHCNVDVYHVDTLHGDGDICLYLETCVGTIESVPDGHGAHYGLYETNSSDLRVFRSNIAGANPLSLFMTNSSRLFAKDVEFQIKDARTAEHCETYLENVTIYGKFKSDVHCKHEWLRVRIMDRIEFSETIYRWKEVEILGNHECEKCTGKAENVEVLGNFEDEDSENHFSDYRLFGSIYHTDCTTKLKGSTIVGLVGLSRCTLVGENTEVEQITDFSASKVEYSACTVANIDGKNGSSYKQFATESAMIKLDESAGEMEGGETGAINLTDSSFTIKAGEAGAISLIAGSLEQYGGLVGAVSIVDGGFTHQGGRAGAVAITDSGFIQQGGEVGIVVLANGAYTAKGGECGVVAGSGALELIGTSSGAITVGHIPIPSCQPGMVVRVGNDKLYEVFDEDVKRWFNKNLEERITLSKKVNVLEDSFHRIEGDYELDIQGSSSMVSLDDMEFHTQKQMSLTSYNDMVLNTLANYKLETLFNISLSSMAGLLSENILLGIESLATLTCTRSAVLIQDLTPNYVQTNALQPPVPTPPDTPDIPDPPEEPIP